MDSGREEFSIHAWVFAVLHLLSFDSPYGQLLPPDKDSMRGRGSSLSDGLGHSKLRSYFSPGAIYL